MATIAPKAESNGIGEAIGSFAKSFSESYMDRADEAAIQKAISDLGENPPPDKLLKAVLGASTYRPESKKAAFANYLGAEQMKEVERHARETESIAREKEKQDIAEKQAKEEKEKTEKLEKAAAEEKDVRQVLQASGKYTPEQIEEMTKGGLSPVSARTIAKPVEATFEKESEKLSAQRANNYINKVEGSASTAQNDLVSLGIMRTLGNEGATGFKAQNALADYLESKGFKNVDALRNPLSKTYNSVAKALFPGMQDIIKGKVSNFEFGILKSMIAQAEDSPQAADAMVELQMLTKNLDVAENQIMQNLLRDYESKGQSPPGNIGYQVEERLRPIADQMTRESVDRVKKILKPGTHVKNQKKNEEIWESVYGS